MTAENVTTIALLVTIVASATAYRFSRKAARHWDSVACRDERRWGDQASQAAAETRYSAHWDRPLGWERAGLEAVLSMCASFARRSAAAVGSRWSK